MAESTTSRRIRSTLERNARAVELRPSLGRKTVATRVRVVDGLRCEVEEGRWTLTADASERSGGTGAGPDPGALGRAALGSCLAIGYAMWAARLRVPVQAIQVELSSDFDARGQYGMAGIRPGHSEIRYHVTLTSAASRQDLQRVVDRADAASMVLDVFSNPQKMIRHLEIRSPEDGG